MSIDLYPALDAGEIDVAVALERVPTAGRVAALGAASLLYKNSDEHWPDDVAEDLSSAYPSIAFDNLASDGATIGEVFGEQLTQVEDSDEPLVTLTIGANDLLSAFGNRPKRDLLDASSPNIVERKLLVDTLRGGPNGLLILTTVFDPSDETGKIPGVYDDREHCRSGARRLNDHIRKLASGRRMSFSPMRTTFSGMASPRPKMSGGTGAGRGSEPM